MLAAINLESQALPETGKIQDVRIDGNLLAEVMPFELTQANAIPELLLRLGHSPAQAFRT